MKATRILAGCAAALVLATSGCAPLVINFGPTPTADPALLYSPTPAPSTTGVFTPTPAPTATQVPTPAPTATPLPPPPITVALAGEPETLHPFYAASASAQTVLGALFVGCIAPDENGRPIALGCERVPTEANGDARYTGNGLDRALEVTFTIRADWRWTDGKPVTAADAVFAWKLMMTPQALVRDALTQKVWSVRAAGPRVAVVRFLSARQAQAAAAGTLKGDVPFDYFSDRGDYAAYAKIDQPLSDPQYWAVLRWLPAHALEDVKAADQAKSAFARKPLGDGAFELAEWVPGKQIILQRTAAPFPLTPAARTERLIFNFYASPGAAVAAVSSGDAQLGPAIPATGATAPTTTVPLAPALVEVLTLNTSRAPFDEPAVRRAIALALSDLPGLKEAVGEPPAEPGALFALDGGTTVTLTRATGADALAAARDTLRVAGWRCEGAGAPCQRTITTTNRAGTVTGTTRQTLSFTLTTNQREPRTALTQLIQKRLGEIGIGVDVSIVYGLGAQSRLFAPAEQGGLLARRDFDAVLYQRAPVTRLASSFSCAAIPNPDKGLGGDNLSGLCDAALDARIRAAELGPNLIGADGGSADAQAAATAIAQASVVIPLYTPRQVLPVRGVRGLRPGPAAPVTWNAWAWER
ncbi:MAG: hypothetical protein K1X39_01760 [Thermoflexales bacterium]|nr:hypothetical protein [Thermoflexales bacterium]